MVVTLLCIHYSESLILYNNTTDGFFVCGYDRKLTEKGRNEI